MLVHWCLLRLLVGGFGFRCGVILTVWSFAVFGLMMFIIGLACCDYMFCGFGGWCCFRVLVWCVGVGFWFCVGGIWWLGLLLVCFAAGFCSFLWVCCFCYFGFYVGDYVWWFWWAGLI